MQAAAQNARVWGRECWFHEFYTLKQGRSSIQRLQGSSIQRLQGVPFRVCLEDSVLTGLDCNIREIRHVPQFGHCVLCMRKAWEDIQLLQIQS